MFTTGRKSEPKCPNCGGILYLDNDGYEEYFTCVGCAREWNKDLSARRITVKEFETRFGIKLVIGE